MEVRRPASRVINRAEVVAGLGSRRCTTEALRIHGWTREPDSAPHLQVYGSDAAGVRRLFNEDASFSEPLHPQLANQTAEVIWHARHEMARTVEDVLARRMRLLLLDARGSMEAAPKVARLLARELRRNAEWEAQQITAYLKLATSYCW